jgi:UPF0755 protein
MRRASRNRWLPAAFLIVIAVISVVLYMGYQNGLQPVATFGAAKDFVIKPGERVPDIASALSTADLIRSRNAFITFVNLHGLRARIDAGTYSLSPMQSGQEIADILATGQTLTDRIVVPEGYRVAQIEQLAADHGISIASFQAALDSPHSQPFLQSKPVSVSLEGYLFPDSYEISPQTTAADLVNTMLNTFGERVGPDYVTAFAAEGLTLHQGLTIASIVESEVSNPTDRPIVAQIFISRLKMGMSLGSDVTAQYAADLAGVPFSTTINSPYNTLLKPGLPPGPICNPGLNALDAVAHPAQTSYLYFLTGKDGKTYYATTYAQHEQNIAEHL